MIELFLFGFVSGVLVSVLIYRQPSDKPSTADLNQEALQALKEQMQYQTIQNILRQQQAQQIALENEYLQLNQDKQRLLGRNREKLETAELIKNTIRQSL